MNKLVLSCPYGNMTEIIPNGLGLNPHGSNTIDACLVDETLYNNQGCDSIINHTNFYASFNETCVN